MAGRIGSPTCEADKRPDFQRWRPLEFMLELDFAVFPLSILSTKVRPIATGIGRADQALLDETLLHLADAQAPDEAKATEAIPALQANFFRVGGLDQLIPDHEWVVREGLAAMLVKRGHSVRDGGAIRDGGPVACYVGLANVGNSFAALRNATAASTRR